MDDGILADPNVHPNDVRGWYGDKVMKELEDMGYDPKSNLEPPPNYDELSALSVDDKRDLSVYEIGLSIRIANILDSNDIRTVGRLLLWNRERISKIINIGESTVNEIIRALAAIKMDHLFD